MEQPCYYKCRPHHSELKRKDLSPANQITKRIRHEHYASRPVPYTITSQMNYAHGTYESCSYSDRQSAGPSIYEHHALEAQDVGQHEQYTGRDCLDYPAERREYKVFESAGQQDVFHPDFAESGRGLLHRCNFVDYAGNYFAPKAGELARPIYDYDTTPFYQSTRLNGIIDPKVVNLFFWITSYCLRWRFISWSCLEYIKGTFVSCSFSLVFLSDRKR